MIALHLERLLDVEPEFGSFLDEAQREQARQVVGAVKIRLEAGPLDTHAVTQDPRVEGRLMGLLVMSGMPVVDLGVGGQTCSRPLSSGSLFWFDGADVDSLDVPRIVSVHEPAQVLLLDDRLLYGCARWPRIWSAITVRLAAQDRRALRSQAISQLPRVEDRLLGLFWDLADQRGEVGTDGVYLRVTLTHETLGRMIGARRPTVSLGLRALEQAGDIRPRDDGWLLSPDSLRRLMLGTPAAPEADAPRPVTVLLVSRRRDLLSTRGLGPRIIHVTDDRAALEALDELSPDAIVVATEGRDPRSDQALDDRLQDDRGPGAIPLIVVGSADDPSATLLRDAADAVLDADATELDILARVQALLSEGSPSPG